MKKLGLLHFNNAGSLIPNFLLISDTGNVIFRSDTANQSYCVRIYQEPLRSASEIYGELYWLLDLQQNTDIIVPEPLRNISGDGVQEIAVSDGDHKFQVIIFRWIPGEIIGSNLDTKTAKQLGVIMAKLHTRGKFLFTKRQFSRKHGLAGNGIS